MLCSGKRGRARGSCGRLNSSYIQVKLKHLGAGCVWIDVMLKPIDKSSWDFAKAAHLLNRAGFGGTPEEIEKLVSLGPEKAVWSLVAYEQTADPGRNPEWAKPDPGQAARQLALRGMDPDQRKAMQQEEQRTERERLLELKHWWLDRMANGPRPLQEKMTLF